MEMTSDYQYGLATESVPARKKTTMKGDSDERSREQLARPEG
jgi:hypothetical protein